MNEMVAGILGAVVLVQWLVVAFLLRERQRADQARLDRARRVLVRFAEKSLDLQDRLALLELVARTATDVFGATRVLCFSPLTQGDWEVRSALESRAPTEVPSPLGTSLARLRSNLVVRGEVHGELDGVQFESYMLLRQIDVLVPLTDRDQLLAVLGFGLPMPLDDRKRQLVRQFQVEATLAYSAVRGLEHEAQTVVESIQQIDTAGAVHRALVPERSVGTLPALGWAGYYRTTGMAGTAFWCVYTLSADRVLITLGDAGGQGLVGTMLCGVAKGCCDAIAEVVTGTFDPARLLTLLNSELVKRQTGGCLGYLVMLFDAREQLITYANAGLPSPWVRNRRDGQASVLDGSGPLLGWMRDHDYEAHECSLESGDVVLLCTAGVDKTRDSEGQCFGMGGLARALEAGGTDPSAICDTVVERLQGLRLGTPPTDDEAVVVIHVQNRHKTTTSDMASESALATRRDKPLYEAHAALIIDDDLGGRS